MGTISTETQQLAEAVRLACIELRTKINGNVPTLAALNTTAKGSLVAAINEVLALAGDGGEPAWADITGKPAAVTALSGTNTGDQDISGKLDISTAASTYAPLAGGRVFTGTTNFENTVVFESHTSFGVGALDAIGTTINFGSGTTFAFSSGAASSMRTALGLGALATSTDAANLTGNIAVARIASALNAGGNPISCTTVTASGAVTITSGNFYIGTTASPDVRFFGSLSNHRSNHVIAWTSGNANATEDTGLSRKTSTPGWLRLGNGTANNASGSLELTNLTASGTVTEGVFTVATTPTHVLGASIRINNATSSAIGSVVAGTGSQHVVARSNGTQWICTSIIIP